MNTEVDSSSLIADEMAILLQNLSPDLRQQVFDFAEFLAQRQDRIKAAKPRRIPGLESRCISLDE